MKRTVGRILLLALFFVLGHVAIASEAATTRETGRDRPGNDVSVILLPAPDVNLCRQLAMTSRYVEHTHTLNRLVRTQKRSVILESHIPAVVTDPRCSSGVKLTIEDESDRPGADYFSFSYSENDPALCRAACADDDRCRAYTFVTLRANDPTATCFLEDKLPPRVRDTCCVSGYRPEEVGVRQYTREPSGGPPPPPTSEVETLVLAALSTTAGT